MKHPLYGKIIRRSKKYHAHDEKNEYTLGDIVRIEETKPISKTKTWAVKDRVTAGGVQAVEADLDVKEAVPSKSEKPAPTSKKEDAKTDEKVEETADADS